MELIISFNGASEVDLKTGLIQNIPWDALMPKIKESVRLREDEVISGLIVDDVSIKVKISRKKGRKTKISFPKK